ncbi:hypothetical protein BN871_BM_00100 [Paenibacillus sp. P22]|nr:hypothetical protein BN871_BM_00100 [Paenibacillus sp. P22]
MIQDSPCRRIHVAFRVRYPHRFSRIRLQSAQRDVMAGRPVHDMLHAVLRLDQPVRALVARLDVAVSQLAVLLEQIELQPVVADLHIGSQLLGRTFRRGSLHQPAGAPPGRLRPVVAMRIAVLALHVQIRISIGSGLEGGLSGLDIAAAVSARSLNPARQQRIRRLRRGRSERGSPLQLRLLHVTARLHVAQPDGRSKVFDDPLGGSIGIVRSAVSDQTVLFLQKASLPAVLEPLGRGIGRRLQPPGGAAPARLRPVADLRIAGLALDMEQVRGFLAARNRIKPGGASLLLNGEIAGRRGIRQVRAFDRIVETISIVARTVQHMAGRPVHESFRSRRHAVHDEPLGRSVVQLRRAVFRLTGFLIEDFPLPAVDQPNRLLVMTRLYLPQRRAPPRLRPVAHLRITVQHLDVDELLRAAGYGQIDISGLAGCFRHLPLGRSRIAAESGAVEIVMRIRCQLPVQQMAGRPVHEQLRASCAALDFPLGGRVVHRREAVADLSLRFVQINAFPFIFQPNVDGIGTINRIRCGCGRLISGILCCQVQVRFRRARSGSHRRQEQQQAQKRGRKPLESECHVISPFVMIALSCPYKRKAAQSCPRQSRVQLFFRCPFGELSPSSLRPRGRR